MGDFSAAKGELRKINVTAGIGGSSYMAFQKVPAKKEVFCKELNERRKRIDASDILAVYDLSFWVHYELVTIHPWADGNGRTSRLLMNLLQWEFNLIPSKVLKGDKSEYIQALVDARVNDDVKIFTDCMMRLYTRHLEKEIEQFNSSMAGTGERRTKVVDKNGLLSQMVNKWSIKPSLAEKLVDILIFMDDNKEVSTEMIVNQFDFAPTSAKRYLRQLTEFGYLEAKGGNKNRTYILKEMEL